MLIEFRVENHRSVRDEQVLTMEAGRVGGPGDLRPREVEGHKSRLLPAAALYGANASGKSNLLAALGFMRDAVLYSHRLWDPEDGVPRDPFGWGASVGEPSLFEVTLLVGGVRYQYGFVVDDKRFQEEWLFAWPRGRKQIWLEREEDHFKFGEHFQGENRLVEQVTRPNALFLSTAAQHRHKQLAHLYGWFRSLRLVNVPGRQRRRFEFYSGDVWLRRALEAAARVDTQRSLFGDSPPEHARLAALQDLLKAADVGIMDLKLADDAPSASSRLFRRQHRGILVRHASSAGEAWLPLEEESQGTLTLVRMGPVFLDAIWDGGVLVVDELEASLHPLLALQIVQQFNDPRTNPKNAQLLFTTHDTNLLGNINGETTLRRDQVWLTEKDREGATALYPLTDYKPRKSENLERGYLQGRYGAIPYLGALARLAE